MKSVFLPNLSRVSIGGKLVKKIVMPIRHVPRVGLTGNSPSVYVFRFSRSLVE
jgi:hypothetical protein